MFFGFLEGVVVEVITVPVVNEGYFYVTLSVPSSTPCNLSRACSSIKLWRRWPSSLDAKSDASGESPMTMSFGPSHTLTRSTTSAFPLNLTRVRDWLLAWGGFCFCLGGSAFFYSTAERPVRNFPCIPSTLDSLFRFGFARDLLLERARFRPWVSTVRHSLCECWCREF